MGRRLTVSNLLLHVVINLDEVLLEHQDYIDPGNIMQVIGQRLINGTPCLWDSVLIIDTIGALCGDDLGCAFLELWRLTRRCGRDLSAFYIFLSYGLGVCVTFLPFCMLI